MREAIEAALQQAGMPAFPGSGIKVEAIEGPGAYSISLNSENDLTGRRKYAPTLLVPWGRQIPFDEILLVNQLKKKFDFQDVLAVENNKLVSDAVDQLRGRPHYFLAKRQGYEIRQWLDYPKGLYHGAVAFADLNRVDSAGDLHVVFPSEQRDGLFRLDVNYYQNRAGRVWGCIALVQGERRGELIEGAMDWFNRRAAMKRLPIWKIVR